MNVPILRIKHPHISKGHLDFAFQTGFTEGYSNNIRPILNQQRTHYTVMLWWGGQVKDFTLKFKLAVDDALVSGVQTADDLIATVAEFYNMALKDTDTGTIKTALIQIGPVGDPWWRRRALVKDVSPQWKEPWDDRGRPMFVDLSVTFVPHFGTGATGVIDEDAEDKDYSGTETEKLLPHYPWNFDILPWASSAHTLWGGRWARTVTPNMGGGS
jgi:hypothetical protein